MFLRSGKLILLRKKRRKKFVEQGIGKRPAAIYVEKDLNNLKETLVDKYDLRFFSEL